MEKKFTKGEWKNEGGDNASIDIVLPNDSTISITRYHRYTDGFACSREEMEANAKLIAAGPDLMEVLEQFVNAIEAEEIIIQENLDNEGYENLGGALYQSAKAAIKKALE